MHDPLKVLLGSTRSSDRNGVEVFASSPSTFLAGLAVRRANTGLLSVTLAAGGWAGVSLGKSLSDVSKTAVLAAGLGVPVLIEAQPARGTIEITDYAALIEDEDDSIEIGATEFVAQSGTVTPGQATFRASSDEATTAASLAAQINAHSVAGALVKATVVGAVVTITAKTNTAAGNTIVLAYNDNDVTDTPSPGAEVSGEGTLAGGGAAADYVAIGSKVYFSNTTGKADDPNSDATISDAIYVSAPMTGIAEDGSEVAIALVDMPGGL